MDLPSGQIQRRNCTVGEGHVLEQRLQKPQYGSVGSHLESVRLALGKTGRQIQVEKRRWLREVTWTILGLLVLPLKVQQGKEVYVWDHGHLPGRQLCK